MKWLPSSMRNWEGLTAIAAILSGVVVYLFADEYSLLLAHLGLSETAIRAFGSTAVFAGGGMIGVLHNKAERKRKITDQELRVSVAAQQAAETTEERPFAEFLKDQLKLAAERGRLLMLRAEIRASNLYRIGTFLTISSVVAPIAAIAVYVSVEPLPAETLAGLNSLRDAAGALPAGISVSVQRDWHILLAGISFGFLFLAASSALFSQHRRQMETLLILGRDVDYYDSMVGAVDIAVRSDEEAIKGGLQQITNIVVAELMNRPSADGRAAVVEPEPSSAPFDQILTLLKSGQK